MVDLAPRSGLTGPPSTVDQLAAGLGQFFVYTIITGDFDRLETLLAPDVRFRAITPNAYQEAATAAGARALVEDWFGGTDSRELIGWAAERVGDRVALGYRVELTEDSERRVVEQRVMATLNGESFCDVAIVCSGFRPLAHAPDHPVRTLDAGVETGAVHGVLPAAHTPAAHLDATGLSCATLTPMISAAVRGLDFGAVLEVITDDPAAEYGLRSWTRLTGNEIVSAEAGLRSTRRFEIRRTPRDAPTTTRKGTH